MLHDLFWRSAIFESIDHGIQRHARITHAKDAGLIDETYYWDEFEDWVKGTSSKKPSIVEASKLRTLAARARARRHARDI